VLLPSVIRWLGMHGDGDSEVRRERQAELVARADAITAAQKHLEQLAADRKLGPDVIAFLNARHDHRMRLIPADLDGGLAQMRLSNDLRLELIAAERDFLYQLLRQGRITDESRRRLERELDLEEATILSKREGEMPL
jgi:CPA1 family monovalent cation:H+ antiporter